MSYHNTASLQASFAHSVLFTVLRAVHTKNDNNNYNDNDVSVHTEER